MAKPKRIQVSDSDQSIVLEDLPKPKKGESKNKISTKKSKKIIQSSQSDQQETPQISKNAIKNQKRKGSKAESVESQRKSGKLVASKKLGKNALRKKQESSSESSQSEQQKQVVKKAKSPKVGASKSPKQPPKVSPISKPKKAMKLQQSSEDSQSQQPIIAMPTKKDKKQAKIIAKKQKKQSDESSQESKPIVKASKKNRKIVQQEPSEQSESEQKPIAKRKGSKQVKKVSKVGNKKAIKPKESESDENSDEESSEKPVKPLKKGIKVTQKQPPKIPKKIEESDSQGEEGSEEKPIAKPLRKVSGDSLKKNSISKKVKQKIEEEDEEGEFEIIAMGLSFHANDSDVRAIFEDFGNILNVKLLTKPDGNSKGIAFIKFSSKNSFNRALELNGMEHMGRTLKIEESQNKGKGSDNRAPNNKNQGPVKIETPTLFVGQLSYGATVESLKQLFTTVGQVLSARIITDKQTGKAKGFGYVEFQDVDTAKKAYQQLNGTQLDGRRIKIDAATQRDRPNNNSFGGARGGRPDGFNRSNNRNPGNSAVVLSQDDKNAKKGSMAGFAGKKIQL